MSRIGKLPVKLPINVEVSVSPENVVSVKGPLGHLTCKVDQSIKVELTDGNVRFSRSSDDKQIRAFHGLYRSLVNNMAIGVSSGYAKKMELVGVGYRASNKGQDLELSLGYSHNIMFRLPDEVKLETETLRGQNPTITLKSHDKELIGQVAAKIRSMRRPEPYKGKGIRFAGEQVRRKAGKAAGKK